MINVIVSIIYLILSFLITIFWFKKFGKYGLYIWMCMLVIICNIQTIKMSDIFGFTLSLGNISYGALFLTTDILSERYGKKAALNATRLSFITMICFVLFMSLFLQYEPSSIDTSHDSLLEVFNYMPRVTFASLTAYYLSQRCDVYIYSKLKNKYNKVWISNNVSTFVSQFVDTLLFVLLSFVGILNFEDIIQLVVTMLLFKWIIALVDTPFIIIASNMKNEELD